MNADDAYKTGAGALPLIAELGYDYAELPLAQVMDMPEADFKRLAGRIEDSGVSVEACNNFFPPGVRLTGAEANLEKALAYADAACSRAAALGVTVIVLGSSGAKNIPPGFPPKDARKQLLALLFRLDALVKPLGITVVLEPLNRQESNFITTAAEGLALVREASLDTVKLLVDYYHLRMEDESLAVIEQAGPDLRHVHIAAKAGRTFPAPDDGEDYAGFFRALGKARYTGRISVEAYGKDLRADAARSRDLLRGLMGATF
jgi:sugar phosphate isomerase/epimerase